MALARKREVTPLLYVSLILKYASFICPVLLGMQKNKNGNK
jgi:hypothetical protein